MEVAIRGEAVLLRSSAAPQDTVALSRAEWGDFLAGAKQGLLDHL